MIQGAAKEPACGTPVIVTREVGRMRKPAAKVSYEKRLWPLRVQGTFVWATGSRYKGGWRNGLQHGKGCFKWKHGDWYEGDWVDGKQTGAGI